jgi:hypothetical protein
MIMNNPQQATGGIKKGTKVVVMLGWNGLLTAGDLHTKMRGTQPAFLHLMRSNKRRTPTNTQAC